LLAIAEKRPLLAGVGGRKGSTKSTKDRGKKERRGPGYKKGKKEGPALKEGKTGEVV